jgi:hypothetical protein
MKYSKPHYSTTDQAYYVTIEEGIRFNLEREGGEWKQSLETLFYKQVDVIIQQTIQLTQGWFSKPLSPEYLKPRLQVQCPTHTWDNFEGTATYEMSSLTISKQAFLFSFRLLSSKPVETLIELEEPEEEVEVPLDNDAEPLSVGPTRRRLAKMHVMHTRAKAAKALYKAEQLTQAYCDAYGDDTDWDDEEDEDEDSDFEEEA